MATWLTSQLVKINPSVHSRLGASTLPSTSWACLLTKTTMWRIPLAIKTRCLLYPTETLKGMNWSLTLQKDLLREHSKWRCSLRTQMMPNWSLSWLLSSSSSLLPASPSSLPSKWAAKIRLMERRLPFGPEAVSWLPSSPSLSLGGSCSWLCSPVMSSGPSKAAMMLSRRSAPPISASSPSSPTPSTSFAARNRRRRRLRLLKKPALRLRSMSLSTRSSEI